jgi:ACT domain-containing protein
MATKVRRAKRKGKSKALDKLDALLSAAISRSDYDKYKSCFDNPAVKKLVKRRDRLLAKSDSRRSKRRK